MRDEVNMHEMLFYTHLFHGGGERTKRRNNQKIPHRILDLKSEVYEQNI
jgi:hypothetical protein